MPMVTRLGPVGFEVNLKAESSGKWSGNLSIVCKKIRLKIGRDLHPAFPAKDNARMFRRRSGPRAYGAHERNCNDFL